MPHSAGLSPEKTASKSEAIFGHNAFTTVIGPHWGHDPHHQPHCYIPLHTTAWFTTVRMWNIVPKRRNISTVWSSVNCGFWQFDPVSVWRAREPATGRWFGNPMSRERDLVKRCFRTDQSSKANEIKWIQWGQWLYSMCVWVHVCVSACWTHDTV